ncbi:MAG: DUF2156 domain-containing protein [Chloroflexi bacterium]|nr:DUF2156 domain-containing protein [Chloroflexota bacterium]
MTRTLWNSAPTKETSRQPAVPTFPEFVPLGLEHKASIDAVFASSEPVISELTFSNLFIWRHYYRIQVSSSGGLLLFLCRPEGKPSFFLPPWGEGDKAAAMQQCLEYLEKSGCAERVPEEDAGRLAGLGPSVEISHDPDNDDYVYNSEDLIMLPGRKYDGKRNAIRKFQRGWRFDYQPVTIGLINMCRELIDYWCTERQCNLYPGLAEEKRAITEAFDNYAALGIRGGAIVMDGRVEAFSLGEKLNRETFVVHIEKANPEIPGLYAVMNQQFARHEASGFPFINREQDLGDQGLREAKESYHPAFKVKKFKVCPATIR